MLESKEKLVTSDPRKVIAAPAAGSVAEARRGAAAPAPRPPRLSPGRTAADDAGAAPTRARPTRAPGGKPGPMPKASAAPSGEPPMPPNPFDKWKVYERKKKP